MTTTTTNAATIAKAIEEFEAMESRWADAGSIPNRTARLAEYIDAAIVAAAEAAEAADDVECTRCDGMGVDHITEEYCDHV